MSHTAGRYIQPAVLAASLAGLATSIYLTSVHFAALQLYCSVSGAIDCERVLRSAYAVIAGTAIPTSGAGILWFAASACLATGRRLRPSQTTVARAQVAWSVLGLVTVLYLVFVEIVELGAICVWCTVAHLLVVAIFVLTVTIRTEEP